MSTLITSTAELKRYFGTIESNIAWSSFESFERDAERDIIETTIGPDALAYFASNLTGLTGIKQRVLEYLQRSAAYLTVLNWSQTSSFRITDKALYISKGSDGVVISDKKLRDFRTHCEKNGYNSLDQAIDMMEKNLVLFPAYAESGIHQEQQRSFIRTALEFSAQRNIGNSRITFLSLREIMLDVQDHYLPAAMGEYYHTYKERFLDDELTMPEKALLPMIRKAIAFLTIAGAGELPLQITGEGIFVNRFNDSINYEQRDAADLGRIAYLIDDQREKGLRRLNDLRELLINNPALYPGFIPPVTADDDVNSKDSGIFIF